MHFSIMGLLIKTDLYKKTVYYLWPIIMNYELIYYEDYLVSTFIVIISKRYKYLNNFALIHLSHSKAASEKYLENDNYYIKNHENEIYILLNYVDLFLIEFKKGKTKFPELFKYIIKFILNSRFLGEIEKQDLKNKLDV